MSERTHKGTKHSRLIKRIGDLSHRLLQRKGENESAALGYRHADLKHSAAAHEGVAAALEVVTEELIDLLRDR